MTRVVLLTTDTTHHLYYAWQLHAAAMLSAVMLETAQRAFPFPTAHPFEEERDRYERETLLAEAPATFEEIVPSIRSETVNAEQLAPLRPDVVLVFGTGRLSPAVAAAARVACLNLHGGNPEEYRGLDSHLWAIYHRDFENLVTTLHVVAPDLDTGDIVASERLPIPRDAALHELRAINTRVCVELSKSAVQRVSDGAELPARPQRRRGRYYSAMPSVLKSGCVTAFQRYTASL